MRNRLLALLIIPVLLPAGWSFGDTQAITDYTHDASGNITHIISENNVQPPVITALNPPSVRRLATNRIVAYGSNLKNANVAAAHSGLHITTVTAQMDQVIFDFTAAEEVIPGDYPLTFSTRLGTTNATVTVTADLAPQLTALPNPIAVGKNGGSIGLQLSLSAPDSVDNTVNLSIADPLLATVSPTEIVIAKGETVNTQPITVTGLLEGQTLLTVNASQLNNLQIPVDVVTRYQYPPGNHAISSATLGIVKIGFTPAKPVQSDSAYSQTLGIVRERAEIAPKPAIADHAYAQIGLFWGSTIDQITPGVLLAGIDNPLNLFGKNLQLITQIALDPADGAVVDPAWEKSADGTQLTVHIVIASGTPPSQRKLVVTTSKGPAAFTQTGGDKVQIQ